MSEPRYGIWIPVYGNCGVMNHPLEPRDASYSRAKNLIQLAQKCGFTITSATGYAYAKMTQTQPSLQQKESCQMKQSTA